jgi:hypothetical protein
MLYIGWARKRRQAAEDKGAASNERISEARTVKKLDSFQGCVFKLGIVHHF